LRKVKYVGRAVRRLRREFVPQKEGGLMILKHHEGYLHILPVLHAARIEKEVEEDWKIVLQADM